MRSLLPLLLIAAAGSAQPTDIEGWGQIHWGMTLDQVRALYPRAKAESNPYWTTLTLDTVVTGDLRMRASASAKQPSDRVTQVRLWLSFGIPSSAPLAGPQDFETLRILLIQKYGGHTRTTITKRYGDVIQTVTRIFPHSTVTLSLTRAQASPSIGLVQLVYS